MNDDKTELFTAGSIIEGKWVLIECIAKGGMGEVYRAHQLNLKRDVAIKLVCAELLLDLEENPDEMEGTFGRFQREIQVMAQVRHPNVLQIFDCGAVEMDCGGKCLPVEYIAMEYVPGNTLRFTMSDEGFNGETAMLADWLRRYFLPVLDGVQAVHFHGIVHRDVKPENILMDGDTPKIADFGLARSLKMRAVSNSWDVKGTWVYMAPEQFSDFRKAGFEADIYALGKILYEAITGKLDARHVPFKSAGLEDSQAPLLNSLNAIIRKATDENKALRYQQILEMRRDIERALETTGNAESSEAAAETWKTRRRWLWAAVAAAILFLTGVLTYQRVRRTPLDSILHAWPQQTAPLDPKAQNPPLELTSAFMEADGGIMVKVEPGGGMKPFYANPTLVTFKQYVRFLNEVDGLQVKDGVVQRKGEIWIYLGQGSAFSDQIAFHKGRFYLRDTQRAPRPVVRVTWLGAQAYARHYGKRLPSFYQWTALKQHPEVKSLIKAKDTATSHPSSNAPDKRADIERAGAPFIEVEKEWLADPASANSGDNPDEVIGHVVQWSAEDNQQPPESPYPWEGFTDVGFRTIAEP